jgi:hypothetical protein
MLPFSLSVKKFCDISKSHQINYFFCVSLNWQQIDFEECEKRLKEEICK